MTALHYPSAFVPVYGNRAPPVPTASRMFQVPFQQCPDEEVSYLTSLEHDKSFPVFSHERCCSTDTSVSTSSFSSNFSQSSTETCRLDRTDENHRRGQKRKNDMRDDVMIRVYKRQPKPPYTYSGMIATVIMNSPNQMLSLSEIRAKLTESFAFFRGNYRGWKDSVRHTLSFLDVFIKRELFVRTLTQKVVKKHIWGVNPLLLTESMFVRKDKPTEEEDGDSFVYYLHDELGLPPVPLPAGETYHFNHLPIGVTDTETPTVTSCETPPITTSPPLTRPPGRLRMQLPSVRACAASFDSPFLTQRHDFTSVTSDKYEHVSPAKTKNEPLWSENHEHSTSLHWYSPKVGLQQNVCDVMNYVAASFPRRSSYDALENLSFLCTPTLSDNLPATHLNQESKPAEGEKFVDNDVDVTKTSCDADDVSEDNSTILSPRDFSMENLLRPLSPHAD